LDIISRGYFFARVLEILSSWVWLFSTHFGIACLSLSSGKFFASLSEYISSFPEGVASGYLSGSS
jgi:hypothetical protein